MQPVLAQRHAAEHPTETTKYSQNQAMSSARMGTCPARATSVGTARRIKLVIAALLGAGLLGAGLLGAAAAPERQQERISIMESVMLMIARNQQLAKQEPREDRAVANKVFDFIIVGAGTAGCVLANRLTEEAGWRVLLLEAGRSGDPVMEIPLLASYIQFSDANWKYKTEPNLQACLGMEGRRCNFPRGKALGGSSLLNFMIHTRGNRRDYDHWEAQGNPGWGYDSVLHYFKKSEAVHDPKLLAEPGCRGGSGPHSVCFPSWHTPLAEAFVQAGPATGSRVVRDYNGRTQTGFSFLQVSMQNGTRLSEARAYLSPIRNRKNLFIKKQALVTRVLIRPDTKQAYGVHFTSGRRNYTVLAKKEVIVCGGAINSPQLLMLSGLGPRHDLEAVGVRVLRDLPVGLNLQDHVALGGLTFLVNETVSLQSERLYEDPHFFSDYFGYHTGAASVPGGCEAVAFYDLQRPGDDDGYPDLELLFQGGSLVSDPALRKTFGIDPELFAAVYEPIRNNDTWMVFPMGLRPRSRGKITLRSRDPTQPPAIYPNYFQHQEDLDVIVEGVKKAIQVAQSEPFKRFGTRLHDIPIPACAKYGFGSDDYWSCAARHLTFTIYHQSGTCKMGPASDPDAVVDPRLRVHGVQGLRVADASIIPVIPAGHTNAPVIMIAEKVADMIKEDWGLPVQQPQQQTEHQRRPDSGFAGRMTALREALAFPTKKGTSENIIRKS